MGIYEMQDPLALTIYKASLAVVGCYIFSDSTSLIQVIKAYIMPPHD